MIPVRTTSRQIETIARWLWVVLVCISALGWWRPGLALWGVFTAGIWTALTLWLWSRTCGNRRKVPLQVMQAGLVFAAGVIAHHALESSFSMPAQGPYDLSGALEVSILHHLLLIGLGLMITQDLLPRGPGHGRSILACALAIAVGPALAVSAASVSQGRDGLVLLGLAGTAAMGASWWFVESAFRSAREGAAVRRRPQRLPAVFAIAMAAWLIVLSPQAAGLGLIPSGVLLVCASLSWKLRRRVLCPLGAALAAGGVILAWNRQWKLPDAAIRLFGRGEAGMVRLDPAADSLAVLLEAVGLVGVGALVLGGLGAILSGLWSLRNRTAREQYRGLIWMAGCLCSALALLVSGGLYVPACSVGMIFFWGLLPAFSARPVRHIPAVLFVGVLMGYFLLMGILRGQGLAVWSMTAFGADDRFLHLFGGFMMSSVLAWWIGSRRLWLGLGAIGLAVAAGAAGEWVQGRYTARSNEWQDFTYHGLGCAISVLPYLLCMGARLCERKQEQTASGA